MLRFCLLCYIIGWFFNLGIRSRKKVCCFDDDNFDGFTVQLLLGFFLMMMMIMMLVFCFTLEHVQHSKSPAL